MSAAKSAGECGKILLDKLKGFTQWMGRFAELLHITQVEELAAVNCMKYC